MKGKTNIILFKKNVEYLAKTTYAILERLLRDRSVIMSYFFGCFCVKHIILCPALAKLNNNNGYGTSPV